MTLDIAALIAPLSEEAPSGPDLSYDGVRMEIEGVFERPVSEDGGESDIDWRKVIDQIVTQGAQTRDIWLPVYLMRAATFARRFDLLVEAAEWLAAMLEERWADLHPQLDEYGFIGRKAPCESLTRISDFLGPLGRVPLIEHARFGRFSCDDIERFADQGTSAEGYGPFRATIEATDSDEITACVERFDALRTAFRRIDGVLTTNADGDTATNFKPTYEKLDRFRNALSAVLPGQAKIVDESGGENSSDTGDLDGGNATAFVATPAGAAFSGSIRNRDDVLRALDAICAYFHAMEPGSPVPLLLKRAREWTGLDFMTVLEDLAPGGLEEASRVLQSRRAVPVSAETSSAEASWGESQASSEW
ncbi:MAG: type VI secretion system ImpA family N-terminal domain-containing protein [Novosphingobium sp.]|uniref:type VI secretion system protein TssA n=1 Tax=Novosphingobium sp. TaxID=1874826 RepID=UPI002734EF85|nr:type VI secretion system ImpA family N-terminal domain-containing protein [Novosphingobium sp.]MDP3550855.1 type VI secretion system ImpA family N-terminal domain-containing protein [Novosphingobium sp.]